MTHSPEPWTLALSDTGTQAAYLKDASGKIIALFHDARDAEHVMSLWQRIEGLEQSLNDKDIRIEELEAEI